MSTKTSTKTAAPKKATKKVAAAKVAVQPTREDIAQLAEKFWMERGRVDGFAEQDWIRAEQELAGVSA